MTPEPFLFAETPTHDDLDIIEPGSTDRMLCWTIVKEKDQQTATARESMGYLQHSATNVVDGWELAEFQADTTLNPRKDKGVERLLVLVARTPRRRLRNWFASCAPVTWRHGTTA